MTDQQALTTRQKIGLLVAEARNFKPGEVDAQTKRWMEALQILAGLGFDPLEWIVPDSDAEADQMVDQLITLLLQVRGDDLPVYDFERHVRDATAVAGDEAP